MKKAKLGVFKYKQKTQMQNKVTGLVEQFVRVFRSSPFLAAMITVEGIYVDVNDRWVEVMGFTREEVLGKHYREYHNMWVNHEEDLALILQGIPVSNIEITFVTKGKQERIGLFSRELVEFQDKQCFYGFVNDITEIRQMEKKLQELERMDLVGQMAAGVAHEIRNPLTTISSYLQVFQKSMEATKYQEHIDLLMSEIARINELISKFLDLARNKPLIKNSINLTAIMEDIHPLLEAEAFRQKKFYRADLQPMPAIRGDGNELRQVIINLFKNGLEAMGEGKMLTIRTTFEEQKVVLRIEDEGSGIPEEVKKNIGKPFYTTKDTGTGLGLAISFNILRRHGVIYEIKTSPEGTVFSLFFEPE